MILSQSISVCVWVVLSVCQSWSSARVHEKQRCTAAHKHAAWSGRTHGARARLAQRDFESIDLKAQWAFMQKIRSHMTMEEFNTNTRTPNPRISK